MSEVLLLSSCAVLYFVSIFSISECASWYYFIFLTTSSSSWLTWASSVVLCILHILVCNFTVGFVLKSFSYLEHRFFFYVYYFIILLCLTIFLFQFLLYFLFPHVVLLYFFQQCGFFHQLISSKNCYFYFCVDSSCL